MAERGVVSDQKKALREGRSIVFIDESGFMLQPLVRRTWAPRGKTPVLKSWDRHDRLSVISAITLSPKQRQPGLYFHAQRQNVKADNVRWFLQQVRKQVGGRIAVVMDRLSAHRTAAKTLSARSRAYSFSWLPAYAPELNPVEFIWSNTKYGKLANFVPKDIGHLEERVHEALEGTQAEMIRSAFRHSGLRLHGR